MKKKLTILLFNLALFVQLNAQTNLNVTALNLENSKELQEQLKPIIKKLGAKKIVGLGEGTHGTKEFNDIRIEIIKELVQKKGFNTICFENAYGDSYYLNKIINSDESIKAGLKKYALSLWQTDEIEGLLLWLRSYNKTNKNKVVFMGNDFNFISNAAKIVQEELNQNPELKAQTEELFNLASFQDSQWEKQNDPTAKIDFKLIMKNGFRGYKIVESIDSIIQVKKIKVSADVTKSLLSCKQGYDLMYYGSLKKEGASRDKLMSDMVAFAASQNKNAKIIVWVHNAHSALKAIYQDDNGGGMGEFLRAKYGNDYYALGTLTANGTYSATKDGIITRDNQFEAYTLSSPIVNSWEHLFSENKNATFFLSFNENSFTTKLKWRPLGYGEEGPNDYTQEDLLSNYFDGIIFIRNTSFTKHNIN